MDSDHCQWRVTTTYLMCGLIKLWLFDEEGTQKIKKQGVVYQGLNHVDVAGGKNPSGAPVVTDALWHTSFVSCSLSLSVARSFVGAGGVLFRLSVVGSFGGGVFGDVSWLSEVCFSFVVCCVVCVVVVVV